MAEENKMEEIMGKKPELEVGRNYQIDLHTFGIVIRLDKMTVHPSGRIIGSGIAIKAKYLGHIDKRGHYNKHVFVFEDANKEVNYAFFDDHLTREIKGVITYPWVPSALTECLNKRYFKEELPKRLKQDNPSMRHTWENRSKLVEILRELGEEI